jgi:DNA-binding CsgD family transcriptional regulator
MSDPRSAKLRAIEPVLLGYRWAVLVVALVAPALGGPLPSGFAERLAALMPILLSVGVMLAAYRPAARPLLIPILLTDIGLAVLAVWLTGGQGSPFVIYMTAGPVHLAATESVRRLVLAVALTVAGYGFAAATTLKADAALTIAIGEVGLLIVLPALVYIMLVRLPAAEHGATYALATDDLRLLDMLANGLRYKEIAHARQESLESAKVAIARLYRRLGVNSRAEALERRRARGLLNERRE